MLENIKYVNSIGQEVVFGTDGLYANENELRDYSWNYSSSDNYINSFYRAIKDKKLPIIIFADTEENGIRKKNSLNEIFDIDVITKKQGKLYIGDYYLECYITESTKSIYLQSKKELHADLKVTSTGAWIRESTTLFIKKEYEEEGLNFPFNYPLNFSINGFQNNVLENDHFADSNFRIVISGYAQNPEIVIGGHLYRVNVIVGEDEQLIIDSRDRTIMLNRNGIGENHFRDRETEYYIFEKIKAGNQTVIWGEFNFEITLFNERSEPIWT